MAQAKMCYASSDEQRAHEKLLTERKRIVSLGQTTRALTKSAKTRFVGAADSDIHEFVMLQVRVALKNPGRSVKDDELAKFTDAAFDEAVDAGETWAVSLKNAYRDNIIKPIAAKAQERGVDPVPAIVTQTDLTVEQAEILVNELNAEASAADSANDEFELDSYNADVDASDVVTATV